MEHDIYSVHLSPVDYAIRTALAVTPLGLLSVVARRMGRGWLLVSMPWLLLVAAIAVYGAPMMKFAKTLGAAPPFVVIAHLVAEAVPVSLFLTLGALAIAGVRQVTQAERA